MILTLKEPHFDKSWMLVASELSGEESWTPFSDTDFDSQRWNFNHIALRQAKKRDVYVFNQQAWRGTSGWEYYSRDQELILEHALAVAAELGLELQL